MPEPAFVLIFDTNAERGDELRTLLREEREFPCIAVDSLDGVRESLVQRPPDVVVARLARNGAGTDPLLEAVGRAAPDATLIAVGGAGPVVVPGLQVVTLEEDRDTAAIADAVEAAAEAAVARREDRILQESAENLTYDVFEGMVGESPKIQAIFRRIRRAAQKSKLTVLILGETGTGKDLIAQAIHRLSDRRKKPFVPVNCAAFSESLLESQLFGHTKGAFTGAIADQKGLFAAADGGTIFLDEIGDMPQHLQTKLLRVLEAREVMPLGSTDIRKVDVRVIAATNSDLESKVKSGAFRADLFYRLHQWEVRVPPLRERRQDIPLLAHHFLALANEEHGGSVKGFSSEALKALTRYYWPGNIRELRNLVEVLSVEVEDRQIALEDLPERIRGSRELAPLSGSPAVGISLADMERMLIERTLDHVEGNRERAAKMLGIGTRTLYRKLKEYGL